MVLHLQNYVYKFTGAPIPYKLKQMLHRKSRGMFFQPLRTSWHDLEPKLHKRSLQFATRMCFFLDHNVSKFHQRNLQWPLDP